MVRYAVVITAGRGRASATGSPELLQSLGLKAGSRARLCFGLKMATAHLTADSLLSPEVVQLAPALAEALGLTLPCELSAARTGNRLIRLGPLIGLAITQRKLAAAKMGRRDSVLCRYSRYAREAGVILLFFDASGVAPEEGMVTGYLHQCQPGSTCQWTAVRTPIPRVIYERCFGPAGRTAYTAIRRMAGELGAVVINSLPKLSKLQTFDTLSRFPEVAPYLPYTAPLTPDSLTAAMARLDDLYLKPNALYKGKGVYRLTRCPDGWLLQNRCKEGNATRLIRLAAELDHALPRGIGKDSNYLVQEGLPLATFLGNRYDFRSLVQRDGRGQWRVSGMVARIAAEGSAITSPRSGGQTALPCRVLQHAFPDRWESVLQSLQETSILLADRLDQALGPFAELGLDMAVVQDGHVKLIEANGKPLRVSLERTREPGVSERIARYPIHFAAWLDLQEVNPCDG